MPCSLSSHMYLCPSSLLPHPTHIISPHPSPHSSPHPPLDPFMHSTPCLLVHPDSSPLTHPPCPCPSPQAPDEPVVPSTTTVTPTRPTTRKPTTDRCMATPPPRDTPWQPQPRGIMSLGPSSPTMSTRKCH